MKTLPLRIWSIPLRRQLMLGIALVHAVLMTMFVLDVVDQQRLFLHEQQIQRSLSLAQSIARNATSWVLAGDVVGLQETLNAFTTYPDLKYAFVTDPDSKVLAHTDQALVGKYAIDPISSQLQSAAETPHIVVDDPAMIDAAAPILIAGRSIGWVRIALTQDAVEQGRRVVTQEAVIYVLLAIAVGTLIAFFIAKGLTRRLSNLLTVADLIRAGRRDRRAMEGHRDELGLLASSFNRMLDALIESERGLQESTEHLAILNENLEQRVNNRTLELAAMANQLAAARDIAENANKAKSAFLAIMSHELRTPLTGVMGMIDLLKQEQSPAQRNLFLSTLDSSAKSLMTLIGDILDFSKIEAGELALETIDFDIRAAIDQVFELFNASASQHGITLRLEYLGIAKSTWVRSDPTRLRQILSNLISNAIKFTMMGTVDVIVTPSAPEDPAGLWRFQVRDTGLGIASTAQKHLFTAFTQADVTVTRRFGGTGLGLAICKRLVEAMGGEIGVESTPGRGSLFWFTLPLQQGISIDRNAEDPVLFSPPVRVLRVLIAEDNTINQFLIRSLVEKMGHRAVCVDNGRQAVDAALKTGFDVILMDSQMPDLDGPSATQAIRMTEGPNRNIAIIGLTADTVVENIESFKNAGITDFLAKPIDVAAMQAALDRVAAYETGLA